MYTGRDMTELSMMSIEQWTEDELTYFHHGLQQMTPYLNAEGVSIHHEIIKEMKSRHDSKTTDYT